MNEETQIFLIRHGSVDNPDDISYGRLPIPLSKKGREEVLSLAGVLKSHSIKFDHLYTSPLVRAKQTAQIIGDELGVESVEVREELNDVDIGELQGAPMQILKDADYSEEKLKEMGFEIETKGEIVRRIRRLISQVAQEHRGENVAMVSHGDVTRLGLWSQEFGEKSPPGNLRDDDYLAVAEAVVLKFDGDRYINHEFIRREKSGQVEKDHIKRTEAY